MKNVIFGSGVVGLIAKRLLPNWTVIPFTRSRFFTFNPALDDNFIIRDEKIDEAVKDLIQAAVTPVLYKRAFDAGGQLFSYDKSICKDWLFKVFGSKAPPQTEPYMNGRLDLFVYNNVRVNQLYDKLLGSHVAGLKEEHAKGKVTEIGDHYFVRGGVKEEFDNAINTIPLTALCGLMGLDHTFEAKAVNFLHVSTKNLDFEGYNQTLVTDPKFPFYKVTNIAPDRYLFYCHEEILNPGQFLMALLKDFEIIDGTSIVDYLTMGPIPKLDWLDSKGIFPIGSYAQWDWCMDISSCILRIIRYAQRDFKPFKKVIVS
jgi:hypothetical protein